MAGINIEALRGAIKSRLDAETLEITVSVGVTRTITVYDYVPNALPRYPCILIKHEPGGTIDYLASFSQGGVAVLPLAVEVRCSAKDGRAAEVALDRLLAAGTGATNSVFDALFTDPTFGGLIGDGVALTASSPVLDSDGDTSYWTATFSLIVRQRKV